MAAAVLTPRVRLMAICDGVRERKIEAGVFDLKGVRYGIVADTFPFAPARLWLFLLLSSHRPGKFPGYVRVIDDSTDKAIFFAKLTPSPRFGAEGGFWATRARIRCKFPAAGQYSVQV